MRALPRTLKRFAALLFVRKRALPARPRSVMFVNNDGVCVLNIDMFHDVPLEIRLEVLRSKEVNMVN